MFAAKSDRQMSYKPKLDQTDFESGRITENKQVIKMALEVRRSSRSKQLIDLLKRDGMSISNTRALQIETAIANSIINQTELCPSGATLVPFLKTNQFVCFHFDNTDFTIDTPDGKNQLHGGLISVFQSALENTATQNLPIDLEFRTLAVNEIQLTNVVEYPKPNLKNFSLPVDIVDSDNKLQNVHMDTTVTMKSWKMLKSYNMTAVSTPPWSGFYSAIGDLPKFLTNTGVLPIIPNPVSDWGTVYTALKIMQGISVEVYGETHKTTISLDLALYEKAVQVISTNPHLKDSFNLRLGELHILMAHLRGIGSYIEGSGIDSIWIDSGVYGPATTRSILSCSHLARTFQAHEDTVIALYQLLYMEFYKEYPDEHSQNWLT